MKRMLRGIAIAVLLPASALVHLTIILVYAWPYDRDELVADGAPLVFVDVHGDEIAALPAIGLDRTRWVTLDNVPTIAVDAVVASEDARFWDHDGVDGIGMARALWLDLRGGRFGGSTLTMQLARLVQGNNRRTLINKYREIVLALRVERAIDKREILEQWFNRAYFGNGQTGFDAAARFYFGKPAHALSDGEALTLAVIPRAPTGYDPFVHRDALDRRRDYVIDMLVARGRLAASAADAVRATPIAIARFQPVNRAPHFVDYVATTLPLEVRRVGGRVMTTLDLDLQRTLEHRVAEQVAALGDRHLEQAAIVVLDSETTGIRAMVGSTGWATAGGQLNMTTRRRHPGSALKPFVYALAIERGDNPATIAWDVRDTADGYFSPTGVEHGPVRYREALASSYNFAAIGVLNKVGVGSLLSVLHESGVADAPGTPDDYGLRLALGAAKVRLVDLTAGYGFLVKRGKVGQPRAIDRAELADGERWAPPPPIERRVFSPATSWMVMDMLADPEARRPGFGMELPFDLPYRVAAKTGTARGFSDTWAIAATNELLVGVWAGSIDGAPTHGVVGMDAAAPLARAALLTAARGARLTLPTKPEDVEDIVVCATSGMAPSASCPRVHDYAHRGAAPRDVDTWHDATGAIHYPARAAPWLARRGLRAAQR